MMKLSIQFLQRWLGRRSLHWLSWGSILLGTVATVGMVESASAAEQLYFTYGALGRSIPIDDLRTFAETGETTSQLRWYLDIANLEPEVLRDVLTQEIGVNVTTIDSITYSLPGEFVLFEIGQVVHTPSRRADIQALRGALIVSASRDNRISLLEFLENYPTEGIYVDGVRLAAVARDVGDFIDRLEPTIAAVQEVLAGLICDCESPPVTLDNQTTPEQTGDDQTNTDPTSRNQDDDTLTTDPTDQEINPESSQEGAEPDEPAADSMTE